MRICLVSEFFYPLIGGITEHLNQFAAQCLKRGHEVTLLTAKSGPINKELVPDGLKIEYLGTSLPIISNDSFARVSLAFGLGKKVQRFFEKNRFDIIHLHPPLVPTLPMLAARYKTAPIVGTVHTYFEKSRFYRVFRKIAQQAIDGHNGFIAVSQPCIDAMRKYFTFNAEIIPNGVNIQQCNRGRRLPQLTADKFTVLFLGRLDPRNGIESLLQASSVLNKRRLPARLIVAGGGPLRPHYQRMANGSAHGDIQFVGPISSNERADYFASADVLCYPALRASFGITILEAMAAGLPVVATNINGFSRLIQPGQNGLLVPPKDPEALADSFEHLANDKNLRLRLAEQGRVSVQDYSWEKVSGRILKFYEKVLGGNCEKISA